MVSDEHVLWLDVISRRCAITLYKEYIEHTRILLLIIKLTFKLNVIVYYLGQAGGHGQARPLA